METIKRSASEPAVSTPETEYSPLEIEIIYFDSEDLIVTSGNDGTWDTQG